MLKGISPLISPDLIKALCEMGHGDEIIFADAHFPGHSVGRRTLRADGLNIVQLLDAVIPLFELDQKADPLIMMQPEPGDVVDPNLEHDYMHAIWKQAPKAPSPRYIERKSFYERAQSSYIILMTGELRAYANIILKKGVIAADPRS